MVAPLEYSNSILRRTRNGHEQGENNRIAQFDSIISSDEVLSENETNATKQDIYTSLMTREDEVLKKINQAANDFLRDPDRRSDVFWEMTITEISVKIVETFRVLLWHAFSGRAHVSLAMIAVDPNARIFSGVLLIIMSVLAWALQF